MTKWTQFLKAHKGYGLTCAQLSVKYRSQRGGLGHEDLISALNKLSQETLLNYAQNIDAKFAIDLEKRYATENIKDCSRGRRFLESMITRGLDNARAWVVFEDNPDIMLAIEQYEIELAEEAAREREQEEQSARFEHNVMIRLSQYDKPAYKMIDPRDPRVVEFIDELNLLQYDLSSIARCTSNHVKFEALPESHRTGKALYNIMSEHSIAKFLVLFEKGLMYTIGPLGPAYKSLMKIYEYLKSQY